MDRERIEDWCIFSTVMLISSALTALFFGWFVSKNFVKKY